jgi:hypothetical protein
MTNVPQETRDALADAYRLFDVSYQMTGTEDDWKQYWDKANKLIQKYGDGIPMLNLLVAYAGIIETRLNEQKTGNKTLVWTKDEDYPHPRK